MRHYCIIAFTYLLILTFSHSHIRLAAQPTFHGAVSAYYSYSVQRPPDHLRMYSTQPATNGQIAIDLAVASMSWKTSSIDFDIALQAGTWADANYVGADADWKIVNQATVRVRPDSAWSIGAGIGPSHIGQEGAINARNMLLSRSLIADYTPYYNATIDVTFAPSQQWTFAVYALNGWQQIVDVNDELSFGTKVDWNPSENTTLSWNTYVGNDEAEGDPSRLRLHSNFYADHRWSESVRSVFFFDVGAKKRANASAYDRAYYVALKTSWMATSILRLGGRVEYMHDPNTVLVMSSPDQFKVVGVSVGADLFVTPYAMVRFETRAFRGTEDVFPTSKGLAPRDLFFTLALSTYL